MGRRFHYSCTAVSITRVYLELGRHSAFAVALDWPGWCRRARHPEGALDELDAYRERYRQVVSRPFRPGPFEIIGTLEGNATTDFGAPDVRGPWDEDPLSTRELSRQISLLNDCWTYFDAVVATAPAALRRGPRGGGRDRDAVVDHVREAERAYSSRAGQRIVKRTPWAEQRATLTSALRTSLEGPWPPGYAIRRCAWHVLDHAWEIEDKST